jgi:hypothetical protein
MDIINIFAPQLYAIRYKNEALDAYNKCIDNWTDVEYVRRFVKDHQADIEGRDLNQVVEEIIEDAQGIDDILYELSNSTDKSINQFFAPLRNSEYQVKLLSRQKGRVNRKSYTRIYGIRIESDCYVITGGALKFTQFMKDREHTYQELKNIDKVRDFLIDNEIIDQDNLEDFHTQQ